MINTFNFNLLFTAKKCIANLKIFFISELIHLTIRFIPTLGHQIGERARCDKRPVEAQTTVSIFLEENRITPDKKRNTKARLALLNLNKPQICLSRDDEWVFSPSEPYEQHGDGDTLNMYYGAADTSIAVAKGSIKAMLKWLENYKITQQMRRSTDY